MAVGWSIPNPTGIPGVFEVYCPPHYKDLREASEALIKRKLEMVVYITWKHLAHGKMVQK